MKTKLKQLAALAQRQASKTATVASAAVLSVGTSVHAALPPEVATSTAEAKTDMVAAAGMVIGTMVVVWGVVKLGKKMGWW